MLWTEAHQAPLSMGFSSHEYWSGLLCPLPVELPNQGMELVSLCLLHWHMDSLPQVPPGKLKPSLKDFERNFASMWKLA